MEHFTESFKSLSDVTRLRIVNLLLQAKDKLCVCDFEQVLKVPLCNISRHLKILNNAKLLERQRNGKWTYYSLNKKIKPFNLRLFATISSISRDIFLEDEKSLKKLLHSRINNRCKR